jgi:hypothetical protein
MYIGNFAKLEAEHELTGKKLGGVVNLNVIKKLKFR